MCPHDIHMWGRIWLMITFWIYAEVLHTFIVVSQNKTINYQTIYSLLTVASPVPYSVYRQTNSGEEYMRVTNVTTRGVLSMVKKWFAVRAKRYTTYAHHSVDMDGAKVHYIDNRVTIPLRVRDNG